MKVAPLLLLAAVLAGCGSPPKEAVAAKQEDTTRLEAIEAPKLNSDKELVSTDVALVRNDDTVHVGEAPDTAFNTLLKGRSGGFISERLPSGFQKPYETKVWQGADDAFGVISYSGKVVAAMYQESHATRDRANEIRQAYSKLMNDAAPQIVVGEKVTYYFWSKSIESDGKRIGGQRLMIMVFQATNRPVFIATAMGDDRVMDAIGMNETQARKDQVSADKMLGRMEANQNAGKT